jgi:hypothetical protein
MTEQDVAYETSTAPQTLFVTDAEMIRRLGVPEKIARDAIRMLDRDPSSRFPQKQALWGDRRYWPAVVDYLDATLRTITRPPSNMPKRLNAHKYERRS